MKCLTVTKITALTLGLFYLGTSAAAVDREGKWYGYFGWNNADYQDSNIHFKGAGYDFTLKDVKAQDDQTPVTLNKITSRYLSPDNITIPQYNYRFGYFFTNNFSLSLGWDHMKYVMEQDQTVEMTGYIDPSASVTYQKTAASGTINQQLTNDFLTYEHTDGFNVISLEGEYYHSIWAPSKGFDLSLIAGGGGGIVLPKSNVKLLGNSRNDEWHLAGAALTAKVGFEMTGWENFFFRGMIKEGYANMYDVLTTKDGGKADQEIIFTEYYGVFGYRF